MNNPQKLTPFKHFCLSIGVIPSAYTDAMTYYELLEWLCNYLQETVIPTVNNNSEVVTELQNLFVQLQDYVDNYFDNLDVQSEIDHKLDEMVQDGTLTNLIKGYVDPIYEAFEQEINNEIAEQEQNLNNAIENQNQLISEQNTNIQTFENNINSTVTNISNKVDSATSGSPKGVYATTAALEEADPDHDFIYLVLADGNWYYYDTGDSAWTAGGVYQASFVSDESIDANMLVANLQNSLKQFVPTLTFTSGYYIRYSNGNVYTATPYRTSSPIHLNKGDIITFTGSISNESYIAVLSRIKYGNENNITSNANFIPLLTWEDTSQHTAVYTATDEGDYFICTTGEPTNVKIYRNIYYKLNLDIENNIKFINNIIKNDNTDLTSGYYIVGTSASVNTSNNYSITDYIEVKELRYVTIETNNSQLSINTNDCGIAFYDAEKNYISGVKYMPSEATNKCTVKTPKGTKYCRFTVSVLMLTGSYALYYSDFQDYVHEESIDGSYRNVLACYSNITCIGDSLTYCQVYKASDNSRQAYIPYPVHLQRLCGNTVTSLAHAGDTAKQCWDRYGNNIASKTNQLTIIYLGTNNGLTDTVATDCAGNDYTTYADNNTGCYGKLIKKSLDAGSKVILVKCYATSNNTTETTNSVIDQFGTKFNVAVVGNDRITDDIYHLGNGNYINNNHYNDLGYEAFTKQLVYNISNLDNTMLKRILP